MDDRLEVRFEGRLVGLLRRAGAGVAFGYEADWLTAADRFPLSASMPLDGAFTPELATLWFGNLLPEGDNLQTVAGNLGVAAADVFGMLEQIGAEAAGAISVRRPQLTSEPAMPSYRKLSNAELAALIRELPARPLLAGEDGVQMSLAGVQDKLPIALRNGLPTLPEHGAPSTHILKPPIAKLHGSVQNEVFCVNLAARLGLRAASAETILVEGMPVASITRYDREPQADGSIRRLHQEDFCQGLGLAPSQKYEGGGAVNWQKCFALLARVSSERARDRLDLLDAAIFNVLIQNTDAHAKNYAMLIRPDGVRLAPLYDLICATPYPRITRNLAMTIAGENRGDHIHGRHWTRFGESTGIRPSFVRTRVAQLAGKAIELAPALMAEHKQLPGYDPIVDEIVGYILARARRLQTNLTDEPAES